MTYISATSWFHFLWLCTYKLVAGYNSSSIVNFLRNFLLLSIDAVSVTFPLPVHKCSLTDSCYLLSFWWESFQQVWGDIWLWFWFAFSWWLVMLNTFDLSMGHLYVFSQKISIQCLCPLQKCYCLFLCSWAAWVPYTFWILIPYQVEGV